MEASLRPPRGGESNVTADAVRVKKTVANRAVGAVNGLRNTLRNWYTFYNGYDPVFTWWNDEPYKALDASLTSYSSFLIERVVGIGGGSGGGQGQGTAGGGGFNRGG